MANTTICFVIGDKSSPRHLNVKRAELIHDVLEILARATDIEKISQNVIAVKSSAGEFKIVIELANNDDAGRGYDNAFSVQRIMP